MSIWQRLTDEEAGTTSVEYAVMLAMILLVLIVGVTAFGSAQSGYWTNIDSELKSNGF